MTVSGSLVQVNGRQRSFQAAMNRSMAAIRSATVGKLPRRRAWRVMIEKNASIRFSHDPDVGVKCSRTRGWRSSQARTARCLWVARLSTTTCAAARAAARARAWSLAGEHASDHDRNATTPLVIDVDATLVTAHSEKESAAPTFKRGFGFH